MNLVTQVFWKYGEHKTLNSVILKLKSFAIPEKWLS